MSREDTSDTPEQIRISEIEALISEQLEEFREIKNGELCLPFFGMEITPTVVDDIFEDLRRKNKNVNVG